MQYKMKIIMTNIDTKISNRRINRVSATERPQAATSGILGIKILMAIAVPITYRVINEAKRINFRRGG